MSTPPRLRLASLAAVTAVGAGLFGAAVGGMARMDSELASAVAPPADSRLVSDQRPSWSCPEPSREAAERPQV